MNEQTIDAEYTEATPDQGQPTTALVRQADSSGAVMSVDQMHNQVQVIQRVMQKVMKQGEHFGVIPGCGDKPTLLQPGAQKLALTFGFASEYRIEQTNLANGHREYQVRCRLVSRQNGLFVGEGVGCCSTMESKYRWRRAERKCPSCSNETIIKGKAEYGGGWVCFAKKGGCGAKFSDGDRSIEGQQVGRAENTDIADTYNTVLKMAKKRACVDAVLTATAASDMFTQDIEDMPEQGAAPAGGQPTPPPTPAAQPAPTQPAPQRQQQPPAQAAPQQQAPQAAPPQQQPPQQPDANNGAPTLQVQAIDTKTGRNANGDWTLWTITMSDGQKYKTFDATHATIAGEAHEASSDVIVRWKQGRFGRDIDQIEHAGQAPAPQQQQQPAPAPRPDDMPNPESVTVQAVTSEPVTMSDGSAATLYRVTTDKGRFGCYVDQVGQQLQQAQQSGEGVMVTWEQRPAGKLIVGVEAIPF